MKTLLVGLVVAGLAGFAVAQGVASHHASAPARKAASGKEFKTLGPGRYTATVKALPCEACGPKVLETMKAFPGVVDASVDQAASKLTFTVGRGSKVDVAALQKKLKSVSDGMGMGSDYSLRDIKAAKAP